MSDIKVRSNRRSNSQVTVDHNEIRKWVESRGGKPTVVKGTGGENEIGILRIDFPEFSGRRSLEPISWEAFFHKFDTAHLAFLYQNMTSTGKWSRFNKMVHREAKEEDSNFEQQKAS